MLSVKNSGGASVYPRELTITKTPTKTSYKAGEELDLTGIECSVTYSDGTTEKVTASPSIANGTVIYEDTTKITFSWTWPDDEKVVLTSDVAVTVTRVLSSISVSAPTKTIYYKGDALNLSGAVVIATFNSGRIAVVTSYATFSPENGSTLSSFGAQTVTASYTENDVTKSATTSVTVTWASGTTEKPIKVTKSFNDWSKADSFTFDLAAVTENAPMPKDADGKDVTVATATKGAPLAVFGDITFEKAGTYKYTITERNDGKDGVSYDVTPHTVTVEVKKADDATNKLTATVKYDSTKDDLTVTNTYTAVETDAYAVFDSSDGSFTFFRDTPGKYTDGQISGTKTYYTGFEDITGATIPSWLNSDRNRQKNTIKTVVFKDKIQPKTCYRWFIGADSLTSITGLYKLDTTAVTSISRMFEGCSKLTSPDLSSFNTENMTDMGRMFYNCTSLISLDVSSFNTAKVTNMESMFYYCSSLTSLDLSSFNTENVTNMYRMFWNCTSLTNLDLSSFNTAKVTDMGYMFTSCNSLTNLDVSSFNTAKVTNMDHMFTYNSKLKTIYASSLFTTDAVSSSTDMFAGCTSLVGSAGTTYDVNHTDKTYARIDGGTNNPGYFTAKQAYAVYDSTDQSMTFFKDIPGKYTDGQVSGTKTYYTGFEDITGKTTPSWFNSSTYRQKNTIKTVTFKDKIKPKICYGWFTNASFLAFITGLDKLDTENVTDMTAMFNNCSSLTSLDVSSFNTENVTDMMAMFNNCSSLKTIYASSLFTTDAVSSSGGMFYNNTSLVGSAGTTYDVNHIDKAYARIDGGTNNPGYFTAK